MIICIGYFVVRWPIPDLLKFVIITSSSFITIMGIYEILIRRINVMRFLFGMKLLPKKSVEVPAMEKALQPKEVIS